MTIFLAAGLLLIGIALIIKGGDYFVDASIWIAKRFRIPEIIIGATIVSIGTTLPEVLTSLVSVVSGMASPDTAGDFNSIAVGNSIGSMLCNMGLILGIVILIKPPKTEGGSFVIKGAFVLAVTVMLNIFVMTGSGLSLSEGIVLLAAFIVFISVNVIETAYAGKQTAMLSESDKPELPKGKVWVQVIKFVISAAAIALGAKLLVDNTQILGLKLGISRQLLGVTVVAIGTSLPELVTSVTALKKGESSMGVGNIIGANVINATLLLGLVSVVTGQGLPIDAVIKNVGIWVMLAITAVLIIPSVLTKKTSRAQGAVMTALYLSYIVYNVIYVVRS